MGPDTKEIGRLVILMDLESSHFQMEASMRAHGTRANIMEKAFIRHHQGPSTTVTGRWVSTMGSAPLSGQMAVSTRVNGEIAERTVVASSLE